MCIEEDRCLPRDTSRELLGVWALAASSKFFRHEMHDAMFETVVFSIDPRDLFVWLDHLAKKEPQRRIEPSSPNVLRLRAELSRLLHERLRLLDSLDADLDADLDDFEILLDLTQETQVEKLRHLTIAGSLPQAIFRTDLKLLRKRAPRLKSVGIQCQDAVWQWYNWDRSQDSLVGDEAWRQWDMVEWMQDFPPTTTIALEAMVWGKRRSLWNDSRADKQSRIRVIRAGKKAVSSSTLGWTDADVVTEVVNTEAPTVCTPRGTQWQQWWRGKGSRMLF